MANANRQDVADQQSRHWGGPTRKRCFLRLFDGNMRPLPTHQAVSFPGILDGSLFLTEDAKQADRGNSGALEFIARS